MGETNGTFLQLISFVIGRYDNRRQAIGHIYDPTRDEMVKIGCLNRVHIKEPLLIRCQVVDGLFIYELSGTTKVQWINQLINPNGGLIISYPKIDWEKREIPRPDRIYSPKNNGQPLSFDSFPTLEMMTKKTNLRPFWWLTIKANYALISAIIHAEKTQRNAADSQGNLVLPKVEDRK